MTERLILLRVGIDRGSGGIQSPMFDDGGFELLPIPDGLGVESRTYGNLTGRHGRPLVDYFPVAQRSSAPETESTSIPSSRASPTAIPAPTSGAC